MKLSLSSLSHSGSQKLFRHFFSSASTPSSSPRNRTDSLYRRISGLGDPRVSVVPVLDQWVREGRTVGNDWLRNIIKDLKANKRFKHALEISEWMSYKRYIPPTVSDVVMRLNLISRVRGLEQAVNYFNNISQQLKSFPVHVALLNCYALEKHVEKAESVMQKLRDIGLARTPSCYNIMMNLYFQMGSWEKLDILMNEMEQKGIPFDGYTFSIRLRAYAATLDCEGIDNLVTRMKSNPEIILDSCACGVAADAYLKVGLVDKALEMLERLEALLPTSKRRTISFAFLLKAYAEAGKKDDVYRIWDLYKKKGQICNKGYMSMMRSLLKLNDIEGAEKIFQEWESKGLSYDFRIPDLLIGAYCSSVHLEKAEALLDKAKAKGGNPSYFTWYYLAGGYFEDNQFPKAVESLRNAIATYSPTPKLRKDILITCLEYLEGQHDVEQVEELMKLLKMNNMFSTVAHDNLLNFIKGKK